jgi:hypothetical protein
MLGYVDTGGELGGDVQMILLCLYALLAWGMGYSLWHKEYRPAGVCAVCLGCVYLWPIASIGVALVALLLVILLLSYRG